MVKIGETLDLFSVNKKKYVTVFLAEGNTKDRNGVGIADDYLEEFGRQFVMDGVTQTAIAYPSAGHPKWQKPPLDIIQSGNISNVVSWYKKQAKDYSIGKFVHTFVRKIKETGKRMLFGIFEISDPKYQKMWNEGKFPKWNSTSIYEVATNKEGFITKAIPVDNCSVNDPHYGIQRAGIYHVCDGGSECITNAENSLLKQSAGLELCNLCKNRSAELYTEFYETNNPHISLKPILQSGESQLVDNNQEAINDSNNDTNADNTQQQQQNKENILTDSTQTLKKVETDQQKEQEQKEKQKEEPERDWKAYAMQLESQIKERDSNIKEKYVAKKDFDVLRKELRANKVSSALKNLKELVPDLFKDEKEFLEKLEYFNSLKMDDDELLAHIAKTTEMYAPLIKENRKLKQSGELTPYGVDVSEITSKLKSSGNTDSNNNKNKPILVKEW